MIIKSKTLLSLLLGGTLMGSSMAQTAPPKPYGAIPTKAQVAWQKLGYYMFIHFGPNTFTDKEWGDGKEDPKVFNPTNVDCRQWARTAKLAGMKGIIITAKHHDGFCLWPSKYSTHTVRESNWKNGKGDLLRELSDACKEYGIKFGVYLSPWDRNHPKYGTSEYNQIFSNTLDEVLGNYGEVFEQWFDGANGEGEGGKKQVYDWDLFHNTVYKNQPNAIIFSDIGPGCRWMGNEEGIAGETNWSRLHVKGFEPGKKAPSTEVLNKGNIDGEAWVPGEVNTSIRPGWFYSPTTDSKVKSVEQLVDFYYTSQGRNGNMLLNVPPDRTGRINAIDSTRLMELRRAIDAVFAHDLIVKGSRVKASSTRANSAKYSATNLLDHNYETYWTTDDDVKRGSFEITLPKATAFNRILLQEYIPLGQRVSKWNVEYWDSKASAWKIAAEATTIGFKRILRFPTVTTTKFRVNIQKSLACPIISTVSLYKAPETLSPPTITRNKAGQLHIACENNDPVIHYTLDGSNPTLQSEVYTGTFPFPKGGTVKAIAAVEKGTRLSEVISEDFDIAPTKWLLMDKSSGDMEKAIDGNYRSGGSFAKEGSLVVDMGESLPLKGFFYVPIPAGWAANIYRYNFLVSTDGTSWTSMIKNGAFHNIKNNPIRQQVKFEKPVNARYFKLEALELVMDSKMATIGEVGIITQP